MKKKLPPSVFDIVPIADIFVDEKIYNREEESEILKSQSFTILLASIRDKGLINPISIVKVPTSEQKKGRLYKVIAGHRRFLAYKTLFEMTQEKRFAKIQALIYDNLHENEIALLRLHENEFRSAWARDQLFDFIVSSIPIILGIPEDTKEENFTKGMSILEVYMQIKIAYTQKNTTKSTQDRINRKIKLLKEITKHQAPVGEIDNFLRGANQSPRTFWGRRKVFEYDRGIKKAYFNRKISFNMAKKLQGILKDTEISGADVFIRTLLLEIDKITARETNKKIEEFLAASKQKKKKPIAKIRKNKLLKSIRDILASTKEKDIYEEDEMVIKQYIEKIKKIVNQDQNTNKGE